ncbi:MAG: hypothetical protein WBA40_12295 [Roseiarcus sp.]
MARLISGSNAVAGRFALFNTWVRSGVFGEKIGDRLTLNIAPAGAAAYAMKVHVANNRMTTDGCTMGGLMCRSMGWTRL